MTTSANVIEYRIERNGEPVGNFRKHLLCRLPDFADLLKYQPLNEHVITPWGYDEEEDEWEDLPENLDEFLRSMVISNKKIREYYEGL